MADGLPSDQILTKVANKANTDVLELPTLYDTVDAEKLDAVIESLDNGSVSFTYYGEDITVTSDGTVTLSEQGSQEASCSKASTDD